MSRWADHDLGQSLNMRTATIEKWTWILIYGGLFGVALGLATRGAAAALGGALLVLGALALAVGIALIWVRSRMRVGDAEHRSGPDESA